MPSPPTQPPQKLTLATLYSGSFGPTTVRDQLKQRHETFERTLGADRSTARFGQQADIPVDLGKARGKLLSLFSEIVQHADQRIKNKTYSMRDDSTLVHQHFRFKLEKAIEHFQALNANAGFFSQDDLEKAIEQLQKAYRVATMQVTPQHEKRMTEAAIKASTAMTRSRKTHRSQKTDLSRLTRTIQHNSAKDSKHAQSTPGRIKHSASVDLRSKQIRPEKLWSTKSQALSARPREVSKEQKLTFSLQLALIKSGAQTNQFSQYMVETIKGFLIENEKKNILTSSEKRKLQKAQSLYENSVSIARGGGDNQSKEHLALALADKLREVRSNGKNALITVSVPAGENSGHAMVLYANRASQKNIEGATRGSTMLMHYDSNGLERETRAQIAGFSDGSDQRVLKQTLDISECLRPTEERSSGQRIRSFSRELIALTNKKPPVFQRRLVQAVTSRGGEQVFDRHVESRHAQKIGDCVTQSNHAFLQDFLGSELFLKLENYSLMCAKLDIETISREEPDYFDDFIRRKLTNETPVDGTSREGVKGYEALIRARERGLELACLLGERHYLTHLNVNHLKPDKALHTSLSPRRRHGIAPLQALRKNHGLVSDFKRLELFLLITPESIADAKEHIANYINELNESIESTRLNFVNNTLESINETLKRNTIAIDALQKDRFHS